MSCCDEMLLLICDVVEVPEEVLGEKVCVMWCEGCVWEGGKVDG
jgi:hypothetical protein